MARARWTTIERDLRRTGGTLIAGVDEVGRGSLAGPVVACAIVMPPDSRALRGVDDSKALSIPARERLVSQIMERAVSLGLGAASAREIDRLNIYHASTLAMQRALSRLRVSPDHVLIDGRPIRSLGVAHHGIVDGDDKCFSIACASIVAKVTRDRLMASLARRHPHYAWDHNCGYATRRHIDALQSHGSCAHHRRSFVVKALLPGAIVLEIIESADAHHTIPDFPDAHTSL
ncbi:MAG TPA: ribonuclease HII [Gemmatimonadaceae bacterium]|nr:ribonuclease HII [Gemmatimonadaceae bacterium]